MQSLEKSLEEQGLPVLVHVTPYVRLAKRIICAFEAQRFDEFRFLIYDLLSRYTTAQKALGGK